MKIKWKRIIINTVIIIGLLLLLGFVFANIDYSRVKKDRPPILAINLGKSKRTNADIYYGLGYIVIKCPEDDIKKYVNKYELYFLDKRDDCRTYYEVVVPSVE